MDGYRLDPDPFAVNVNTHVSLFRGISLARNNLPIVAKRHDFYFLQNSDSQKLISQCLNAALAQAKVQHLNACDILEVQLEVEKTNCVVYHILEGLEGSAGQDIEDGKKCAERDVREFLLQTSSALEYAHRKVSTMQDIAHRDVKPDNVFRTATTYKLGDFGCFFAKREVSVTKSVAGDARYMSPQLRKACMNGSFYNPFKADVFALAASALHLTTLLSQEALLTLEPLDEEVGKQVRALPCSQQLQELLIAMLAYEEERRPTMQEVCATLSEEVSRLSLQTRRFAAVWKNTMELYDVQSRQSTQFPLSVDFGLGGSFIEVDSQTLLCLGAHPASTAVYELDLLSAKLTCLPSLLTPRAGAGVAKASDFVYTFGGWNDSGSMKSCEKYSLQERQWRPLRGMLEPRRCFTPCYFRALIYLPCPLDTSTIETFSPLTDTFAVLSVSLPSQMERWSSVAFVANEELFVLTVGKQLGRWRINSDREFRLTDTERQCWSSQPPLVTDSLAFIACRGKVEMFSLQSCTFV